MNCMVCGEPVPPRRERYHAKYCSSACSRKIHKLESTNSTGVPPGTVGAIGELRVASDLLMKGYDVFRAMSPSCSCDLIIKRDSSIQRVEVRTGTIKDGKPYCVASHFTSPNADIVARVFPEEIIYSGQI